MFSCFLAQFCSEKCLVINVRVLDCRVNNTFKNPTALALPQVFWFLSFIVML